MHLLHSLTRRLLPVAGAFLAALSMAAAAQSVEEGKEYLRLKNPQPVESGKKIEVIEFFSYGCPHCADLEPILQGWVKTMPADVQLRRIPVMYQERWIPLAKVYYTLDALGEEKRLSPRGLLRAALRAAVSLWQDKTFFDWAASQGLDRKKVEDMYNSFAISGKVNARSRESAGLPGPIGADVRRRRKIRHLSSEHPRRDAGGARRADRESTGRTSERLMVVR
jgi:thiol:disulfide interchange protein DsbA